MKRILILTALLAVLSLSSCRQEEEEPQVQPAQVQPAQMQVQASTPPVTGSHTGVVQEILQASAYTYVHLKEADKSFWIAITKTELDAGETISFAGGHEMPNFFSKDLNRTFESVLFVSAISKGSSPPAGNAPAQMMHSQKPTLEKKEITIEPVAGGITIKELFANRAAHANQTVLIKGQVTKVNRAIMDQNWVHLQDGTSDGDDFDLTITTKDDATVGDVVTFQGKIALKKDFGAGYAYDVIMQEGKLLKDDSSAGSPTPATETVK